MSNRLRLYSLLSLIFFFILLHNVTAQILVTGDKVIGSSNNESIKDLEITSDGGFIIFGHSNGNGQDISSLPIGGYDYLLVKTDESGNVVWDKLLGSTSNEFAYGVAEDKIGAGGYVVVGYTEAITASGDISTNSYGDYSDMWIAKVAADGSTILWEKRIGGNRQDYALNIVQASDGGYLISAFTNSSQGSGNIGSQPARGNYDALVIKIDNSGNISWTKRFGGNQFENFKVLRETSDGGFITACQTFTGINGDKTIASLGGEDVWLTKFDASRNIVWQKVLGGTAADKVNDVLIEENGNINILLTSSSSSNVTGSKSENSYGNTDAWLVNLSPAGNLNWDKTYGGSAEEVAVGLAKDTVGNIVISTYSRSGISGNKTTSGYGNEDLWTLKVDKSNGNIIWDFTHGGSNDDTGEAIVATPDGGIVISSTTTSAANGNKTSGSIGNNDFWLVKYFGDPLENTRYAIASANWNDPTTWSLTPGGLPCCEPNINSLTYIDGFDVILNSNHDVRNVSLSNNANLNIENAELHIYGNELTVDATSAITEQLTQAKIIFTGNETTTFTNNSTIGILLDEIDMNKDGKLTIEGTGDIYLNNDLDIDLCDSLIFNATGTITIADDIGVSTSNATIINNSANILVLDDIFQTTYENNVVIENHGSIICDGINLGNNNGTFRNYGTIENNEFLSIGANNEFHNYDNANWIYRGELYDPQIKLFTAYTSNHFIYDRAGDQEIIPPQDSYYYVEFASDGTKFTKAATLQVDRDLTIKDNAILDAGTFGTDIIVRDDFESFSSQLVPFIPGTNKVTIGANLTNRIESVHGIRFYNLEINSTDHFNLKQKDLIIENNLHMINGLMHSENDGRFVINDDATVTGYDASKYMVGPVQKIGNDPFTFPVGDNGNFRPLSMSAPSSSSDAFTVHHYDETIPAGYPTANHDYSINNILNCSYWLFQRNSGSSEVEATASWSGGCTVTDLNHLSVASWNGSQWVNEGNGGTTGTTSEGSIQSNGVVQHYEIIALANYSSQPNAVNDNYSLNEDQVKQDNLLSNDTDPMGYNLTANTTLVDNPVNGTLVLNDNGEFTYTPDPEYSGADSVTYAICNDATLSKCDTAKAYFTIIPVNDLPLVKNDTLQVNEDEIFSGNVLTNDTEPEGQPLQSFIVQPPINGVVNLSSDGMFTYTPNADFSGNDIFEYEACDDQTPSGCTIGKVMIEVIPVNDPPVAVDDQFYGQQYSSLSENVITNDYDIDSDQFSVALLASTTHGTINLQSNGEFIYVPENDFSGNDQFSYVLTDDGNKKDTAMVNIEIAANSPPQALDQTIDSYDSETRTICIEATDLENDVLRIKEVLINTEKITLNSIDSLALCFEANIEIIEDNSYQIRVVICDAWSCDTAAVNINGRSDITVVYQALSPNNDGQNDEWIIDGIENYPDNKVFIFNRYGQEVFYASGYNNTDKIWRGSSNKGVVIGKNETLPDGTYFYKIDLGNGSKPKQGFVVLQK